ncbi:hypothetical protein ES708_30685 [subsurface metagenome]
MLINKEVADSSTLFYIGRKLLEASQFDHCHQEMDELSQIDNASEHIELMEVHQDLNEDISPNHLASVTFLLLVEVCKWTH